VCIEYGRLVYDNLKKVIIYLLPAGTFCELWPILFPIFFGLPQPLSSIEMIIISMLTDCIASMSLIKEKPEADVLLRPPRRPSKDRLTNTKLLFQAYFIIGVPMLVCACSMSFRVFAREGLPFPNLWRSYGDIKVNGVTITQEYYQQALYHAQSTYFLTLVLMHQGTLFMIRTRRLSIVQQPPIGSKRTRNLYLFGAMIISVSLMLLFLLSSPFQTIFNTRAPSLEYWFIRKPPIFVSTNFQLLASQQVLSSGMRRESFSFASFQRASLGGSLGDICISMSIYYMCVFPKFAIAI
jgi:sodium/potassium-transporting ATPase subunit alpha